MPISCHEERERSFIPGPIWSEQAFRFPIDTLPIPEFPKKFCCRFASRLEASGPILDRIGLTLAHLRGLTFKEADATTEFVADFSARMRSGPKCGPLLDQLSGSRRRIRRQISLLVTDESSRHEQVP